MSVSRKNQNDTEDTWKMFLELHPEYRKYYQQWLESRLPGVNPLSLHIPWITYPAIEWLSSAIGRHSNVFEWGMGGSTIFLAEMCRKVVSVEHDPSWFEMAKLAITEHLTSSILVRMKRRFLSQLFPDLHLVEGKVCSEEVIPDIGSGANGYRNIDFSGYVNQIDRYPLNYFDFILVDGRARMDCFIKAVPYCRPGGYIMLDNSDYSRYRDKLKAFEMNELRGWEKKGYLGPGPSSSCIGWRTTVYQKPK